MFEVSFLMIITVPSDGEALEADPALVGLRSTMSAHVRNGSLLFERKEGTGLPLYDLRAMISSSLLVVYLLNVLCQALSACVPALTLLIGALKRPFHRADLLRELPFSYTSV